MRYLLGNNGMQFDASINVPTLKTHYHSTFADIAGMEEYQITIHVCRRDMDIATNQA